MSLFDRLSQWLLREPKDREQLKELLHHAHNNNLLDDEALRMIEGVLRVAEMQVRDVMIPRAQMVTVHEKMTPKDSLATVIEAGHSRFPVIGGEQNSVVGILLAKDLLQFRQQNQQLKAMTISQVMRPATCIPESKRLNILLQEFRINQNHMAIVVEEFGNVAGLVTIEDVLEQIVGEIEDEYDIAEGEPNIKQVNDREYRIKALTPIEDFNAFFDCHYNSEDYDTFGGLVLQRFSHFPKRGESIKIKNWQVTVLQASSRGINLLSLKDLDE